MNRSLSKEEMTIIDAARDDQILQLSSNREIEITPHRTIESIEQTIRLHLVGSDRFMRRFSLNGEIVIDPMEVGDTISGNSRMDPLGNIGLKSEPSSQP